MVVTFYVNANTFGAAKVTKKIRYDQRNDMELRQYYTKFPIRYAPVVQ